MELPVDDIAIDLPRRLKSERHKRGWSLAQLAEKSGVSRAMISRIERGEVSATAALLARLAQAFDLALANLFTLPAEPKTPLRRFEAQPVWRDPASGYVRRAVSAEDESAAPHIVDVTFPPGATVLFDVSPDGSTAQHVWLLEGDMHITLGAAIHVLAMGDCLSMRLDQPIAFHNPGKKRARYAVILWKTQKESLVP